MNFHDIDRAELIPPMPAMATDDINGLQILFALRRNSYMAFPPRCLKEPVVKLQAAWQTVVLTCAPEAIRHVMMTHADDYVRLPLGQRVVGPIAGRGLLISEGELWRRQRRAMAPAFAPRNLSVMTEHIARSTEMACARLAQSCGTEIDLLSELQGLSLEIAARSMFSIESAAFCSELRAMISEYTSKLGRVCPSDVLLPDGVPTPMRIRRAVFRRRWRKLIRAIVAARRAVEHDGDARDLFDLLSDALGPEQQELLVDEVSTMLVAGHETTALTLFWACTLLAHSPRWQSILAQEASRLDLSVEAAAASLPKLVHARAVVQETLRLYPPVLAVGRQAQRTHDICGTSVPEGSMILLAYWLSHRDPRLWERPDTFDPLRFVDSEIDRFAYLPFGIGPHVCIGAQLALSEATWAIARLMQQFSIAISTDRPVIPVGAITTRPDHAPAFVLQPRGHL
jgi:cytochrome P450